MLQTLPALAPKEESQRLSTFGATEFLSDGDSPLGMSPVSPLGVLGQIKPIVAAQPPPPDYTRISLSTLVGCSEMLGHSVDDRARIADAQQPALVAALQESSDVKLRSASQRPLFIVAPLDVLVTRDAASGRNKFHIIEINGTGIAGLSNMPDNVVGTVMRSISEVPAQFAHVHNPVILVASSGQESNPPVSR